MDDGGSGSAHCGTVDDGRCGGRRHGRWAVQRAAARTMAQGGGRTRRTHGCTEGEETEETKRKQRQRFLLRRLRGEARQTLGGERPYLCAPSPLPATHSHVLLHAQAPCGYHRPPSTPELLLALGMVPDGPPLAPIPARGRIRRTATWRSTTHDHAFPIPCLTLPRTTRVPPLRQPAVPIPAPAVTERVAGSWLVTRSGVSE